MFKSCHRQQKGDKSNTNINNHRVQIYAIKNPGKYITDSSCNDQKREKILDHVREVIAAPYLAFKPTLSANACGIHHSLILCF